MELPIGLRIAIENEITGIRHEQLKQDAQMLSKRYRNESKEGRRLITSSNEAAAYSVVRMPATYGAVYTALRYTLNLINCKIESLMDVGAGTGTASWAADSLIPLKRILCLERERAMVQVGQRMMREGSPVLRNAEWVNYDLAMDEIPEKADLVIASYVLNELTEKERIKALDKLWQSADKILLIVEPGTSEAYFQLKRMREYMLTKGAHIISPCPHENGCGIPENDWCHFSCRIPRSKLHRLLKEGELPYEDEKFTYLAIAPQQYSKPEGRILRHPIIEKGRVTLDICCPDGIRKVNITKKDGELYKKARKANWGDEFGLTI
ncbi:small ribosomal subunit Rsm22 family protein [Lutispora thermophila]|uniref:Ribosomal protein RSM22 (Predicted rRNA methylase) n=1 Tax=Lutispora thermophila DSM 19022 TaxID=1122184 RepID=A0A1M6H1F2_9FIRM|nr:small ribosomal subunit Rsm22 family protein [Lutispora thermophila]SHJ16017.1 Ribosomal protein RSM22 (predicted rRNA methylase) [Lutispora thermophila DSM 19022]